MSQILITRRIVGDIATRQISSTAAWRRSTPSSSLSMTSLACSLDNLFLSKRCLSSSSAVTAISPMMSAMSTSMPTSSPTLNNRRHNNNQSNTNNNNYFSSVSSSMKKQKKEKPTIAELPSNLKFDPRCTASPFYGMDLVKQTKGKAKAVKTTKAKSQAQMDDASSEAVKVKDDGEIGSASTTAPLQDISEEDGEDDYDDEEDMEEVSERILYDLTSAPPIPTVIPLPQRLHVPIHTLTPMTTTTNNDPSTHPTPIGTIHLSPETFGISPIRIDILHRCVIYQRNKKRGLRNAGAKSKTISEKRGSTRKVRAQKGMGRARAGHSRPAHWRGGAKAHGPKGRIQDYNTKLNKKVRKLGVRNALSQKLKEGNLIILGDMNVESHKTKVLDGLLNGFGVSGRHGTSALMIDDAVAEDQEGEGGVDASSVYGGLNVNLKVASGNLYKVKVMNQLGCNVYDILKFRKVFLSLAAVKSLEERLEKDL